MQDTKAKAAAIVRAIGDRQDATKIESLGHLLPLGEYAAHLIEAALIAERERAGGASATYFNGLLVIVHPDIPPHVWDGTKMEPIGCVDGEHVKFQDGFLSTAIDIRNETPDT